MLDLIYINFLRGKVRCLEREPAPGAGLGSTARERYVPWTRPEQLPPRPTMGAGLAMASTAPSMRE